MSKTACSVCAMALAVGAFPALALSPVTIVDDASAQVTRSSYENAEQIVYEICVRRPAPRADYAPGRLGARLFAERTRLSVPVEIERVKNGRECFIFTLGKSEAADYSLTIFDRTAREPWHSFYSGKIAGIAPVRAGE